MKVTAIIPAFNEEETIADVVAVLCDSSLVQDVIVVSDGSSDRTVARARSAGAKVFDLPVNQGKGASMLYGLSQTDAQIILFADADLRGFTAGHVEQLVRPVLSGARFMNIGLRDRGWLTPFTAYLPLISGERVLRRQVMESISPRALQGYMIESALNYSCRSRKLRYGAVTLHGLSIRRKYEKVGWLRAIPQYIKMSFEIIKAMVVVRVWK
ncbi:MAG: glycosyltransferase [Patescibacteria group bacterium]